MEPLGDAPGGCRPDGVAVEQHLDHHLGMVVRTAAALPVVGAVISDRSN